MLVLNEESMKLTIRKIIAATVESMGR